jgi:hypothetical protein
MTTRSNADKLVDRYLSELDQALRRVAAPRRRQIVEDISDHIAQGRPLLDDEDEAGVRSLLERVGEQKTIATEAGTDGLDDPARRGDAWVPWLLLLGGYALLVGWFVGVGLLWSSATWRVRDKILGTLVLPGGLLSLVLLGQQGSVTACSAGVAVSPIPIPVPPGSTPLAPPASPGVLHPLTHCVTTGFSFPLPIGILVLAVAVIAPILVAIHLERVRRSG